MSWNLTKKVIPKGTILENFLRNGKRYKEIVHVDTEIEVLENDGVIWMSDTKMERDTNAEFIDKARGDVLIAGLDMGWVIMQIQEKPEVKSITVVEIDRWLIDYIKGKRSFNEKVTIMEYDIWDYLMERQDSEDIAFDIIWLDIWSDICGDNLVDMYPMEYLAENMLRGNGEVFVWSKEACEESTRDAYGRGCKIDKKKVIETKLEELRSR